MNALAVESSVSESFTIAVKDGHGGITEQTITARVTNTNDGPVLSLLEGVAEAGYTASEAAGPDSGTGFGEFFAMRDADVQDESGLTYRVDGATATNGMAGYTHEVAGANGTLYYNSGTGENLYVPNGNVVEGATAADTFTVKAVDAHGGASGGIALTVTVSGSNSAPTLSVIPAGAVNENFAVTGQFKGTDADTACSIGGIPVRDVLTYSVSGAAATNERPGYASKVPGEHGTLYYNSKNGNYLYEATDNSPGAGVEAGESFEVTVGDDKGDTDSRTLTITVTGTNDAPVVSAAFSGDLDGTVSFTDADTLFATGQEDSHSLSIVYNGTAYPVSEDGVCRIENVGAFTLTPSGGRTWTYAFTPDAALKNQYRAGTSHDFKFRIAVNDGHETALSAAQTLSVAGTNAAAGVTLTPDIPYTGTFTVSDAEGDAVRLKVDGKAITGKTVIGGDYSYKSDRLLGDSEQALGALDAVLRDEGNELHELHDAFAFSADDGKGATVEKLEVTLTAEAAGGSNSGMSLNSERTRSTYCWAARATTSSPWATASPAPPTAARATTSSCSAAAPSPAPWTAAGAWTSCWARRTLNPRRKC